MANAELEQATSEIMQALRKIADEGDYSDELMADAVMGAAAAFVTYRSGVRATVLAFLDMATGLLRRPDRLS